MDVTSIADSAAGNRDRRSCFYVFESPGCNVRLESCPDHFGRTDLYHFPVVWQRAGVGRLLLALIIYCEL